MWFDLNLFVLFIPPLLMLTDEPVNFLEDMVSEEIFGFTLARSEVWSRIRLT